MNRAGLFQMFCNQATQVFLMDVEIGQCNRFDGLFVHAALEVAIFVKDVSKTARHTRAEVDARCTENRHDAARHVFTRVVACTFNH